MIAFGIDPVIMFHCDSKAAPAAILKSVGVGPQDLRKGERWRRPWDRSEAPVSFVVDCPCDSHSSSKKMVPYLIPKK